MGAGLLPIALNFLAPTLIAGPSNSAAFLHWQRGLQLLGVIGRRMVSREVVGKRICMVKVAVVVRVCRVWRGVLIARVIGGEERRGRSCHGGLSRIAAFKID